MTHFCGVFLAFFYIVIVICLTWLTSNAKFWKTFNVKISGKWKIQINATLSGRVRRNGTVALLNFTAIMMANLRCFQLNMCSVSHWLIQHNS